MVVLAFFFLYGSKSYKQITCWSLSYWGNPRKGFGWYRISCLLHYLSIHMDTNSLSYNIRTLFENSLGKTDLRIYKTRKQENKKTRISSRILLFSCRTILFEPIGREKQNFTSFLLVEIKLFIKKTKIFLMIFLFRSFFCFVNPFSVVE